jgi:hypothetical protein
LEAAKEEMAVAMIEVAAIVKMVAMMAEMAVAV